MAVRLVTIEEHHEAYYVWHYARMVGWLPPEKLTLLHVDAHADMALPRLSRRLGAPGSLEGLAEFTYSELNINNFIWPAVSQGLFERLWWMRTSHGPSAGSWRRIAIQPGNAEGTEFVTSVAHAWGGTDSGTCVEFWPLTPRDNTDGVAPLVLDIDLDYFCWNERPDIPPCEVEITAAAHDEYRSNRYHRLRISPGCRIGVTERAGRYYLVFGSKSETESGRTERVVVEQRLEQFAGWLRRNPIRPNLISLCRSLRSGYLAREHAAFVEDETRKILKQAYDPEPKGIQDLLPAGRT